MLSFISTVQLESYSFRFGVTMETFLLMFVRDYHSLGCINCQVSAIAILFSSFE